MQVTKLTPEALQFCKSRLKNSCGRCELHNECTKPCLTIYESLIRHITNFNKKVSEFNNPKLF